MAQSKYAGLSKDALTAEIKNRRAANRKISVDLRADEDALRAALDTDDVENGDFGAAPQEKQTPDAPPALPDPVKAAVVEDDEKDDEDVDLDDQLAKQPEAAGVPIITDEQWKGAKLYRHLKDKLTYEAIVLPSDPYEKPVKARVRKQKSGHPGLFWEGSQKEFAEAFEKI